MTSRLSKWLLIVPVIPVVIVVLLLAGVTIPLDFLDARLESLAADLLDRDVSIQGPVRLRTSLQPRLDLGGLTIGNPRDWDDESGHLLRVEKSSAQLSLTELLRGNVHIKDLEFTGVDLRLLTRGNHTNNFQFVLRDSHQGRKAATKHELSSLDRLRLHEVRLSYIDELSSRQFTLEIDEARGQGKAQSPLELMFSGKLGGKPCRLELAGGSLKELLDHHGSWPLTGGRLTLADVSVGLTGSLNFADKGLAGYLALALEGHSLPAFGRSFNLSLPDIGDFSLAADITLLPGIIQFTTMRLTALHNTVEGDLILALSGDRPMLAGDIAIAELTPEIMAAFQADDAGKQDRNGSREGLSAEPPWEILQAADMDLRLRVGSVRRGDLKIGNLKGVFSLVDGDLLVPVSMQVMDLPLSGQFEVATSGPLPTIRADVSSPGADLSALFDVLSAERTLQGRLGALSFKSRSSGTTFGELFKKADLELRLGPTIIKNDSIAVVAAEALHMERSPQGAFSISATGELLGSPLALDTSFGKAAAVSGQPGTSLHLGLKACDTELLFDAGSAPKGEGRGNRIFSLKVEGERLCGFLEPAERFMGRNFSFATVASGSLTGEVLTVDVERVRLGKLNLNGRVEVESSADGKPRISGVISSERIDLAQILRQKNSSIREPETGTRPEPLSEQPAPAQTLLEQKVNLIKNLLAVEILPIRKFLTTDVHLEIEVDELITGLIRISDLQLTLEAEEGKLRHSPFQARIGGSLFTGSAAVDTTATIPLAHLDLATEDFSLSELLKDFEISRIPDLSADHVGLDLSFKGKTLQEMLVKAYYLAQLRNGRLVLPRESLLPVVLHLERVDYVASPGQPAMMSATGDVNNLSLALEMTGEGVFARGTGKPVVISAQADLADTRVEVDGQINRKNDTGESFRLSTMLSGTRMDSLNELLGVNLPPLGPYRIEGALASKKDNSIGLYDMGVQIGASKLHGELIVSVPSVEDSETVHKPLLQIDLSAPSIQLNDFRFEDWSPLKANLPDAGIAGQNEPDNAGDDGRLRNILGADLAKAVNGTLGVQVREVLSGSDNLGNGQLNARLEDGRYSMDNLRLDIPGGTIRMAGELLPEEDSIKAELQMEVKQFDYGILARRTKPDSALKGEVNLALDLNSRAETPIQLKEKLNGRLRIGIVPEEYEAGTIDLWAVNIIRAALPALLSGDRSVVNCLAGDFTLQDGILRPDLFVMDTSKMRVRGTGVVNFKTNEIDFHLKPTPKSAQFFSLATPISISGSIMKPDIGVTTAGVVTTLFRQLTSVVTVPFQWLFSDNMEADGAKVCSAAMQWAQSGRQDASVK